MNSADTTAAPAPDGLPPLEKVTNAELQGTFPEISPNILKTAAPALVAAAPDVRNENADALGRIFDASKFKPEKDTLGRWKNLRGGRPKGGQMLFPKYSARWVKTVEMPKKTPISSVPASFPIEPRLTPEPAAPAPQTPPTPQPAALSADHLELTAEAYLRAGYAVADTTLDAAGEWQPDDAEEHKALKASAVAYLRTNSGEPLPPGVAFAISLAVYSFKRISRTRTAAALRFLWSKISGRPAERPAARPPQAPVESAPTRTTPPFEMPTL